MKWVRSLTIQPEQTIEQRLKEVILQIREEYKMAKFIISDIDATSKTGNQLTISINNAEKVEYNANQLLSLLEEDGQIFELKMSMFITNDMFIFSITRGADLEVLGRNKNLIQLLGQSTDLDPNLFEPY